MKKSNTDNENNGDVIDNNYNNNDSSCSITYSTTPIPNLLLNQWSSLIQQLFTYSSMSPVSAMSGVISPTSMSLFTSPGTTPRTTPRSTPPVPRWNTPFINLDENMDYTTMSTLMPTLPADATSAQLIEDGWWRDFCLGVGFSIFFLILFFSLSLLFG